MSASTPPVSRRLAAEGLGARSLSDSFAGIAPAGASVFITAQLLGAGSAAMLARWLFDER